MWLGGEGYQRSQGSRAAGQRARQLPGMPCTHREVHQGALGKQAWGGACPHVSTCCLHRGGQLAVLLGGHKLAVGRSQSDPAVTPLDVKVAAGVPGEEKRGGQCGGWRQAGCPVPGDETGQVTGGCRLSLTWWTQWTARPRWPSASSTCPCGCGRHTFLCPGRSPAGRSPDRSLRPDWPTGPFLQRETQASQATAWPWWHPYSKRPQGRGLLKCDLGPSGVILGSGQDQASRTGSSQSLPGPHRDSGN